MKSDISKKKNVKKWMILRWFLRFLSGMLAMGSGARQALSLSRLWEPGEQAPPRRPFIESLYSKKGIINVRTRQSE